MPGLWAVFRIELTLLLRGRGMWLAAPATAFFGIWEASSVREAPFVAWSQFTVAALFVTLILTLSTGGQITRDRDRRINDVLLSTPVATPAYVWGKYLAALSVSLGVAVLMLVGALGMDRFDIWTDPPAVLGHSHYPSLGPWPYVTAWLWLVVAPVLFGAALALATVTLTNGQRVVSSMLAVFLWLGPGMLGGALSGDWTSLLDISGLSLYSVIGTAPLPGSLQQWYLTGANPPPDVAAQVVQIVVSHLPPNFPAVFYWNRALFLSLAIVLVTVARVARQRRGAA